MCGSMPGIQSAAAEIRRGKKEERRKKEERTNDMMKIQWSALFHWATIINIRHLSKQVIDTKLNSIARVTADAASRFAHTIF